MSPTEIA
jgi:hypothetical protein